MEKIRISVFGLVRRLEVAGYDGDSIRSIVSALEKDDNIELID